MPTNLPWSVYLLLSRVFQYYLIALEASIKNPETVITLPMPKFFKVNCRHYSIFVTTFDCFQSEPRQGRSRPSLFPVPMVWNLPVVSYACLLLLCLGQTLFTEVRAQFLHGLMSGIKLRKWLFFASSNKFELRFLSVALKCPGIFWFVKVHRILASQKSIRKQTQFLNRQNILTDSSLKKVCKLQIIT